MREPTKSTMIAMVLVSVFTFCLVFSSPSFAKTYSFRLANIAPPMSSFNTAIFPFWIKKLEEASNGRIKIKVYPAEQLAKAEDLWEATESGIADIGHLMMMTEAGRFPVTEYGFLPMLFDSSRSCAITMTALYEKYPEIQKEFESVKLLWINGNAPAELFTVKKPINTLEDLKGLRINGGGLYWKDVAQQLGFSPMSFPFPEVYDGLSKGVMDGNTVEWEGQVAFKWYELDDYSLGKLDLFVHPFIFCMNKKKWDKLPSDIQDIFNEYSGVKGAEMMGYIFDQYNNLAEKHITKYLEEKGKEPINYISDEFKAEIKKKLEPVRDLWKAEMKKMGVPADMILKDAEAIVEDLKNGPELKYWDVEEMPKTK